MRWLHAVLLFPMRGPLWRRLLIAVALGLGGVWLHVQVIRWVLR